jgi:propanol-preferring alcohol dehydrogenase
MKALQYRRIGAGPELVDIPVPEPGPGEVLLQVTAAGVCHSDDYLMGLPAESFAYELPMTLGHECAGIVAAVGVGVQGVELSMPVVVYGPRGCGMCRQCANGEENYCARAADVGVRPPGLGAPGAMAEYMIAGSPRYLVPIGDLDPVATVPLTDAGLTPYHAIKRSLPKLTPGSSVVVLGVGGLGHVAISLLSALCSARIIALDIDEAKLQLAKEFGAHEVLLSDAHAVATIEKMTGDDGAAVVLDFVGLQSTLDIALAVAGTGSDVRIVGIGDRIAHAKVGFGRTPFGSAVSTSYWGSLGELYEVIALARRGMIDVETVTYSLDDGVAGYQAMSSGAARGRVVVVP